MISNNTYIYLWRSIMGTSFYKKPLTCHLAIHLLLTAAWKDHYQIIGGKKVEIKRGQIPCGRNTLADQTGLSPQSIRTCINHLVRCDFLTIESTNICSIITIEKYDEYQSTQSVCQPTCQPTTNQPPTNHQPLQNKGKVKKEKNNTPLPPKGGDVSKPPTWKTDFVIYLEQCERSYRELTNDIEWIAYQERLNPNIDILLTMEKAKANYWGTQEAWKKKKRQKIQDINWKSTWQNALGMTMNRVFKDAVLKSRKNESQINNSMPECDLNSMTRYED